MSPKICKNKCGKSVPNDRGGLNKANRRKAAFCSDDCCKAYWGKKDNEQKAKERDAKKKEGTYTPKGGKRRTKMKTTHLQDFLSNK